MGTRILISRYSVVDSPTRRAARGAGDRHLAYDSGHLEGHRLAFGTLSSCGVDMPACHMLPGVCFHISLCPTVCKAKPGTGGDPLCPLLFLFACFSLRSPRLRPLFI